MGAGAGYDCVTTYFNGRDDNLRVVKSCVAGGGQAVDQALPESTPGVVKGAVEGAASGAAGGTAFGVAQAGQKLAGQTGYRSRRVFRGTATLGVSIGPVL